MFLDSKGIVIYRWFFHSSFLNMDNITLFIFENERTSEIYNENVYYISTIFIEER